MKVTAPSRFAFNSYYPRWGRRCNSLIGHEGNRSIEIYFQYLLPTLPLFYCFTCLWLVFFLCRKSSASRTSRYRIFILRHFSPCSSSLVNTPLKVRLGFRCAFPSMHFCLLHVVPTLLSAQKCQVVCSIYYPRWVSRCNSLIGHESNSSIEICFQHLLPPPFYCLVCLCSFLCRMSSASRTSRYPYSL